MIDVSIIIVGTNELDDLQVCLRSVFAQTRNVSFETIVVDNASSDSTSSKIPQEFPSVIVLRNEDNRGFAAANNQGLRIAKGRYVLLLNPDTEILNGAIEKSVVHMDDHESIGVLGCKMYFADGSVQPSVGVFPSLWNQFIEATFLNILALRPDMGSANPVDWLSGAYLMIRRQVLEKIGLLDEQFYMYTEEVDFCWRARARGFSVWYFPHAEIRHYWGGAKSPSLRTMYWAAVSKMLFYEKHFGGWRRRMLLFLKIMAMIIRIPGYLAVGMVTLSRVWFTKAGYQIISTWRLLRSPIRYNPNHEGPVIPWPAP